MGREEGGGLYLEMGVANTILRCFWRFFMMQRRNKILMC